MVISLWHWHSPFGIARGVRVPASCKTMLSPCGYASAAKSPSSRKSLAYGSGRSNGRQQASPGQAPSVFHPRTTLIGWASTFSAGFRPPGGWGADGKLGAARSESGRCADCCVRAEVKGTYYNFTALSAKRTKLEVEVHTDPKGLLPNWLVNLIQKKWPSKTLSGLIRHARKGNASHPKEALLAEAPTVQPAFSASCADDEVVSCLLLDAPALSGRSKPRCPNVII